MLIKHKNTPQILKELGYEKIFFDEWFIAVSCKIHSNAPVTKPLSKSAALLVLHRNIIHELPLTFSFVKYFILSLVVILLLSASTTKKGKIQNRTSLLKNKRKFFVQVSKQTILTI